MSYTIKLKSTTIQMGKTSVINKEVNPTAGNSSDFNLVSLNVSDNLNLKYCSGSSGVLHTDISGNVITKLIDTSALSNGAITATKIADSIYLSGIPTVDTAPFGTDTTQIATCEFVQDAVAAVLGDGELLEALNSLNELAQAIGNDPSFITTITDGLDGKVSLATDEDITGEKTFTVNPIFSTMNVAGVIHNDASGNIFNALIDTTDISDGAITFDTLDTNLVLPSNTTVDPTTVNSSTNAIVTKGFLDESIKPFTDALSNFQPTVPSAFFHVTNDNILYDELENPYFELSDRIRHVIDIPVKIILPPISIEGVLYSLINKSGATIVVSTSTVSELIFNAFVAPDGDNDFDLGANQSLEFVSIESPAGFFCWQASYY